MKKQYLLLILIGFSTMNPSNSMTGLKKEERMHVEEPRYQGDAFASCVDQKSSNILPIGISFMSPKKIESKDCIPFDECVTEVFHEKLHQASYQFLKRAFLPMAFFDDQYDARMIIRTLVNNEINYYLLKTILKRYDEVINRSTLSIVKENKYELREKLVCYSYIHSQESLEKYTVLSFIDDQLKTAILDEYIALDKKTEKKLYEKIVKQNFTLLKKYIKKYFAQSDLDMDTIKTPSDITRIISECYDLRSIVYFSDYNLSRVIYQNINANKNYNVEIVASSLLYHIMRGMRLEQSWDKILNKFVNSTEKLMEYIKVAKHMRKTYNSGVSKYHFESLYNMRTEAFEMIDFILLNANLLSKQDMRDALVLSVLFAHYEFLLIIEGYKMSPQMIEKVFSTNNADYEKIVHLYNMCLVLQKSRVYLRNMQNAVQSSVHIPSEKYTPYGDEALEEEKSNHDHKKFINSEQRKSSVSSEEEKKDQCITDEDFQQQQHLYGSKNNNFVLQNEKQNQYEETLRPHDQPNVLPVSNDNDASNACQEVQDHSGIIIDYSSVMQIDEKNVEYSIIFMPADTTNAKNATLDVEKTQKNNNFNKVHGDLEKQNLAQQKNIQNPYADLEIYQDFIEQNVKCAQNAVLTDGLRQEVETQNKQDLQKEQLNKEPKKDQGSFYDSLRNFTFFSSFKK